MIVIFDVDGVIFETSKSYHLAIVETVKFYTGKEGINKDEILDIKFKLGINNDWDVSVAGIIYTKGNFELDRFLKEFKEASKSTEEMYKFGERYNITLPEYKKLIKYFENIYSSLRKNEEMIVSKDTLKKIRGIADITGVITGRPFEDLDYSFKKFNLYPFFDYIITDDDSPLSSQKKPSSYPLKLFFKRFPYKEPSIYIGDTIADRDMVKNYNSEENKNVRFILLDNPFIKDYEGIEYKVKTEEELLNLLERIHKKAKWTTTD